MIKNQARWLSIWNLKFDYFAPVYLISITIPTFASYHTYSIIIATQKHICCQYLIGPIIIVSYCTVISIKYIYSYFLFRLIYLYINTICPPSPNRRMNKLLYLKYRDNYKFGLHFFLYIDSIHFRLYLHNDAARTLHRRSGIKSRTTSASPWCSSLWQIIWLYCFCFLVVTVNSRVNIIQLDIS